jgi:hypothetical protein
MEVGSQAELYSDEIRSRITESKVAIASHKRNT